MIVKIVNEQGIMTVDCPPCGMLIVFNEYSLVDSGDLFLFRGDIFVGSIDRHHATQVYKQIKRLPIREQDKHKTLFET